MDELKIPKKLHYCWFGESQLPESAVRCINSWKKYCPDYEIIEWNENNFDINKNVYTREAYGAKKWAFVSDVARLYVLINYGGIYMDTDVELIKPLDSILKYEAVSGFECETQVPTGLMACREGHPLFLEFLKEYESIHFIRNDGSYDFTTNVTRITNICLKYGLRLNNTKQVVRGFTLLPNEYFCPKNSETLELKITPNTICIHHFDASWHSEEDLYIQKIAPNLKKLPAGGYMAKFFGILRFRGLKTSLRETIGWLRRKINMEGGQ